MFVLRCCSPLLSCRLIWPIGPGMVAIYWFFCVVLAWCGRFLCEVILFFIIDWGLCSILLEVGSAI